MRRSNIPDSGRGAFATKDYKPGDVVAIYWCRPVCNLKHPPIVTPHAHRSASLVCSRTPVRDTLPPFETRRRGGGGGYSTQPMSSWRQQRSRYPPSPSSLYR